MTKYWYDEAGNVVETEVYAVYDEATPANNVLLSTTRTLFDAEGRAVVTVGPYAAGEEPVGTETVYDALGRAVETRRWENVEIQLTPFIVDPQTGEFLVPTSNQTPIGKRVGDDKEVKNAWDGTGTAPGDFAWLSDGEVPNVESANCLSSSRTEYDAAGRVWKSFGPDVDDEENLICTQEILYDAAGRQAKVITLPGDSQKVAETLTGYDGQRQAWTEDARGYRTSFEYDALGRVTRTIHPATGYKYVDDDALHSATGAVYSHVGYDGFGRKLYETPPVSSVTYNDADKYKIFSYDAAGRLTMVMLPEVDDPQDVPDQGMVHPLYRYIYDIYGNQVGILDPKGRLTALEYNAFNQLTKRYMPFVVANPSAIVDAEDVRQAVAAQNPTPISETTTYDPHGRVTERVDYEGHTTVYRYYVNDVSSPNHFMGTTLLGIRGQLRVEENYIGTPGGNPDSSIVYEYDSLGRKIKETMTPGTNEVYLTQYDDEGRILILESPQGDLYYEYDPQTGRKVSTASYPSTMTFAQILADATATPTPFTSSMTRTVYTYDDLGRLETVQVVRRNSAAVTENATTYRYNINGSQEKVIYPNGNEAVYEYDALNRLYKLTNFLDDEHEEDELLSRFEYSCFADGQRAIAKETCKGWKKEGTSVNEVYLTREMAYRYDGLGRLIWEQRNDHDPNSFTYDLAGNRVKQVIGGRSNEDDVTIYYGYNDRDQLQWEGPNSDGSNPTITYQYDANGSLTSQTQGTTTTTYVYDLRNRLQTVTTDSVTTAYGYSPDGIRVRRQVGTETPTVYLVDPMNLTGYSQVLEAWEGGSTPAMTYTLGGDVIAQAAGSTVRFLIYDGHGSVRNHANSTGALEWFDILDKVYKPGQPTNDTKLLTYDAWGQECNGLSDDGLYYTGEMYDTKLSMYNLRARWYSPAMGRFNAVDPYAGSSYDPQTLHKYLYCHADPINGIDPSGEIMLNPAILKWIKIVGAAKAVQILLGIQITYVLGDAYIREVGAPINQVDINRQIARFKDPDMNFIEWVAGYLSRPDIVDHSRRTVYEIKPDNYQKIIEGKRQLLGYIALLDLRYPGRMYCPGTWQPRQTNYYVLSLPAFGNIGLLRIQAYNAGGGVIAYRYNTEDFRNLYFMVQSAGAIHMVGNAIKADMARIKGLQGQVALQGLAGRGLF